MLTKKILWTASFSLAAVFFVKTYLLLSQVHESYDPDETQLTDPSSVTKYLENFSAQKNTLNEKRALKIPTGIFVQSIKWKDTVSYQVTGYVWQKSMASVSDDVFGFIFPETTKSKIRLVYREIKNQQKTLGWYFEAEITQDFDYEKFPLDHKTLKLRIWPKQFRENILLIPDFASYESTKAQDKFGIDSKIVLGSYTVLETFFRFEDLDYDTNFGLDRVSTTNVRPELFFNIVLKRKPLDAFVVHVFPLLVILVLCFLILLSHTVDSRTREVNDFSYLQVVTSGAGLFFVVSLAHIHIREIFEGMGIIYLEYLHIISYVSIVYITLNAFLAAHANLSNRWLAPVVKLGDNIIPKLLFLPVVSVVAFMISKSFL